MKIVFSNGKKDQQIPLQKLLPQLIHFCKDDPQFGKNERIKEIKKETDDLISRYKERLSKFNEIEEMHNRLQKHVLTLKQKNDEERDRLLGELGSEIWK